MLRGSLSAVAEAALRGGPDALAEFGLQVGQALKPMLASSAPSIEAALSKIITDPTADDGADDADGLGVAPAARLTLVQAARLQTRRRLRRWSGSLTASAYRRI